MTSLSLFVFSISVAFVRNLKNMSMKTTTITSPTSAETVEVNQDRLTSSQLTVPWCPVLRGSGSDFISYFLFTSYRNGKLYAIKKQAIKLEKHLNIY